jgi:spermidine synthase
VRPRWRALLVLALLGYGVRLGMVSKSFVDGYQVVVRNFYSQLRVSERHDGGPGWKRVMVHGRINHGEQYLSGEERHTPNTYYCHESGIGRAIFALPQERPLKLGMVGLGAGTLAAYGRSGDTLRIYEINEQVLELANSHFTYLADSPARIEPVLGDGRLMLEREPDQGFDLLALDAFSGDAIPAHLLTLESMRTYLRHLKPDGILAVHITNRYLDLKPVMAAAARHVGRTALLYAVEKDEDNPYCYSSDWVLIMAPERAAALPLVMNDGEPLEPRPGFRPWTDGFSNLFSVLK